MERELTEVYCGNGKGKTALAIGQSIREAVQGKSVIVIQFLKGCEKRSLDFMEDLDNLDFKIFRFEKSWHLLQHRYLSDDRTGLPLQKEYLQHHRNHSLPEDLLPG